jgi:hypothetical protein
VAHYQLDAKVNPATAGPIIDEQGRVVGLITLKQAQAEGIGLACRSITPTATSWGS